MNIKSIVSKWCGQKMDSVVRQAIADAPNPFQEQRPPGYPKAEWERHQAQIKGENQEQRQSSKSAVDYYY